MRKNKQRNEGISLTPLSLLGKLIHCPPANQGNNKQYKKNKEEHFCNTGRTGSNATETEYTGYNGYDQKDDCPP
jgi:hypothetical protein